MPTPSTSGAYAASLLQAALDGQVPVVERSTAVVASACGWMIARAGRTLTSGGGTSELLGATLMLARADQPRPTPDGRPDPAATVVWLAAQEAAGRHELVDKVLTTFLSADLPAGAVVVAQVTAHLLRLVDGPGAHATLRAMSGAKTR